jgi:hypothetical protein
MNSQKIALTWAEQLIFINCPQDRSAIARAAAGTAGAQIKLRACAGRTVKP